MYDKITLLIFLGLPKKLKQQQMQMTRDVRLGWQAIFNGMDENNMPRLSEFTDWECFNEDSAALIIQDISTCVHILHGSDCYHGNIDTKHVSIDFTNVCLDRYIS